MMKIYMIYFPQTLNSILGEAIVCMELVRKKMILIVITDAMPNLGKTNKSELSKYVRENAEKNIYTLFSQAVDECFLNNCFDFSEHDRWGCIV